MAPTYIALIKPLFYHKTVIEETCPSSSLTTDWHKISQINIFPEADPVASKFPSGEKEHKTAPGTDNPVFVSGMA
jgi:hypothetical protein